MIVTTWPHQHFRLQDEPLTTTPATRTSPARGNPLPWIVSLLATIIAAVLILRIPPPAHPWPQNYDPTGRWWLSALLAALPVVVLLGSLGLLHMKAHYSALLGLATSLICSISIFGMPASLAMKTARVRRGLRFAADRLDHPERHLHVPTHLRGGTVQSDAGQPDRDHPGPPPAVAADCIQLRRVL